MAQRTRAPRTADERIQELESKIADVRRRLEEKQRKDSPVLKEFARVQRVIQQFVQVASEHGRDDVALSAQAFLAGLERSVTTAPEDLSRRRARPSKSDDYA